MANSRNTKATNTGVADTELSALTVSNNKKVAALEKIKADLHKEYKEQEQITVQGAPMYQKYFGNTMTIAINGITVCVPLNGQRYQIPKTFAKVFNHRIASVNEQLELQKRLSNASDNYEHYAGELDLISRV